MTINREFIRAELTGVLQQILPGQTLQFVSLPLVPEIELLLFDDDEMHRPLHEAESEAVYALTPYWLFCWASGQALAKWVWQNPKKVAGKRVLDYGCGSGVVAIAAAKCGAAQVVALDQDKFACVATHANAGINSVDLQVVEKLEDIQTSGEGFDLILAADVLYDQDNYYLLDFFLTLGQHVMIADSRLKRMPHAEYRFVTELESITLPDMGELKEFSSVKVYKR